MRFALGFMSGGKFKINSIAGDRKQDTCNHCYIISTVAKHADHTIRCNRQVHQEATIFINSWVRLNTSSIL